MESSDKCSNLSNSSSVSLLCVFITLINSKNVFILIELFILLISSSSNLNRQFFYSIFMRTRRIRRFHFHKQLTTVLHFVKPLKNPTKNLWEGILFFNSFIRIENLV